MSEETPTRGYKRHPVARATILEVVDELPPVDTSPNRNRKNRQQDRWAKVARDMRGVQGWGLIHVFALPAERKAAAAFEVSGRRAGEKYGFVLARRATPDGKHVRYYVSTTQADDSRERAL